MGFSHEYLIELSECWRWRDPDFVAQRRALWPEVLTWSWFLDPARIEAFELKDQIEIMSVATLHAHKVRAPLWDRPQAIYRRVRGLTAEADEAERFAIYRRVGAELDAFDEQLAATARAAAEAEAERQRAEHEARAAELAERRRAEAERAEAERVEAERVEAERVAALSEFDREAELERERAAELERERAAAAAADFDPTNPEHLARI